MVTPHQRQPGTPEHRPPGPQHSPRRPRTTPRQNGSRRRVLLGILPKSLDSTLTKDALFRPSYSTCRAGPPSRLPCCRDARHHRHAARLPPSNTDALRETRVIHRATSVMPDASGRHDASPLARRTHRVPRRPAPRCLQGSVPPSGSAAKPPGATAHRRPGVGQPESATSEPMPIGRPPPVADRDRSRRS